MQVIANASVVKFRSFHKSNSWDHRRGETMKTSLWRKEHLWSQERLSNPEPSPFFFMSLQPRVEWYTSLWALNTSPPRNRFTFLWTLNPEPGTVFEPDTCDPLLTTYWSESTLSSWWLGGPVSLKLQPESRNGVWAGHLRPRVLFWQPAGPNPVLYWQPTGPNPLYHRDD